MTLWFLTSQPAIDPKRAVRFITDTNVVAPVLRWMALDAAPPGAEVVDALSWLHGRAMSARFNGRDIAFDARWAAVETSRRQGIVDGNRLALMEAAQNKLCDWLKESRPLPARFSERPRLRAPSIVSSMTDGWSERGEIAGLSLCLLRLSQLDHRRRSGELRTPTQRFDALEQWAIDVEPVAAMSPHLLLVAIQTAHGGSGSPARAMCKFGNYRDRESARKLAANAAWDMHFLRLMRNSELGLNPYQQFFGPTTLLTFDGALAASARDLVGTLRGSSVARPDTSGAVLRTRGHLQSDVLLDASMLARLDAWTDHMNIRQRQRWQASKPDNSTELESSFESLLHTYFSE